MTDSNVRVAGTRPLRVGVLGASGQLGRCLVRAIAAASDLELAFAATRAEIDLTAEDRIAPWLDGSGARDASDTSGTPRPAESSPLDVVVNAAAFTKVDACETQRELAYQTNALAPAAWARELADRGVRFIHLSTDYVFPGDGDRPYREDDPTEPRTVYGSSKRAGEIAVLGTDPTALVVRTSWVFGPGRNFVAAILDQAVRRRSGELSGPMKVVNDQRGTPTSSADLADALLELARRGRQRDADSRPAGLLHLTNAGETTWFDFARAILDRTGFGDIVIDPVPTSAFQTAAKRPAYSVLDCQRAIALGIAMRPWSDALASYLVGPDRPASLCDAKPASGNHESTRDGSSRRPAGQEFSG
jgi:dTDP-4-dehydrorhamnose reductase